MLHKTEGIVLKSVIYGEADLIVSFLTSDFGLMRAFAKSPRKTKSRFGSSLEPFTYSKIAFWGKEDSKLPRLTQADIIEPNQQLRENISLFTAASEMAILSMRLLPEWEPSKKAFELLKSVLRMLRAMSALPEKGRTERYRFLHLTFGIRLLDITGYSPSFRCGRCGRAGQGPAQMFYTPEGSVICIACSGYLKKGHAILLSAGAIRLYESLRTWDIEKINRIKPLPALLTEIEGLLKAHISYLHPEPMQK